MTAETIIFDAVIEVLEDRAAGKVTDAEAIERVEATAPALAPTVKDDAAQYVVERTAVGPARQPARSGAYWALAMFAVALSVLLGLVTGVWALTSLALLLVVMAERLFEQRYERSTAGQVGRRVGSAGSGMLGKSYRGSGYCSSSAWSSSPSHRAACLRRRMRPGLVLRPAPTG